jgi:hypothetical protein
MTRSAIFNAITTHISAKIQLLQQDISDLLSDLAGDTKSSAGDKFETSREMSQQEISKLTQQVNEQKKWLNLAANYSNHETSDKIVAGSIVTLSTGQFLIGLPLGKIPTLNGIHCIGNTAPLSQMILNKKVGEAITFQHQIITIEKVS